MTKPKINVDDAEAIKHFVSKIKDGPKQSKFSTVTTPLTDQQDQRDSDEKSIDDFNKSKGPKTPPHATVPSHDSHHLASPESHPKPSPHVSGLTAPFNTPWNAPSSPRLAAMNSHNEDVGMALSEYVNNVDSRPLSESIWATGSVRYKPSTLNEARSTKVLTPVKAVEPNPAINDTFDRMSFKAADMDHGVGENLIGDHLTRSTFTKASAATSRTPALVAKVQRDKVDDVDQAKLEHLSNQHFKPATETGQQAQKAQIKSDEMVKENSSYTVHSDSIRKQNEAAFAKNLGVPPHLRAIGISDEQLPKAEPLPPRSEASGSVVRSKVVDPGLVKNSPRAAANSVENKVITSPTGTKPQTDPSSLKEDLEHKMVFNAWPKQEERGRAAAKIRTVIIKELPRDSTARFVASLVYGGAVESIHIRSTAAGDLAAVVRFMDAGDCMKYYEETSNGLVYGKDDRGRELVLFVELSKDVDVIGGLLQTWIASGVTRCVRAVGVEAGWDLEGLVKIAERKNRKVETIVDGQNAGGARSVVFHFCQVEDAVRFKAALSRDEEWEHCNIHYSPDPCSIASGVHFES